MEVSFWGVRGSLPCAGVDYNRYGGNTSCVLVMCGEVPIILDSGTGIRSLGESLISKNLLNCHLLYSHVHWDHIMGFPFFSLLYSPKATVKIRCGNLLPKRNIKEILNLQMSTPNFPIGLNSLSASLEYIDFEAGDSFNIHADISVMTTGLNHPDGATGYRINYRGKSVCYITDTEHTPDALDFQLVKFLKGADLLIYDSTYTDSNFSQFKGWGHSTWQEGIRLSRAADIQRLAIFHHDPASTDTILDQISVESRALFPNSFVASEGTAISL
jgi:phosphoribosyl 1,2-cyclic phosphodiesterase